MSLSTFLSSLLVYFSLLILATGTHAHSPSPLEALDSAKHTLEFSWSPRFVGGAKPAQIIDAIDFEGEALQSTNTTLPSGATVKLIGYDDTGKSDTLLRFIREILYDVAEKSCDLSPAPDTAGMNLAAEEMTIKVVDGDSGDVVAALGYEIQDDDRHIENGTAMDLVRPAYCLPRGGDASSAVQAQESLQDIVAKSSADLLQTLGGLDIADDIVELETVPEFDDSQVVPINITHFFDINGLDEIASTAKVPAKEAASIDLTDIPSFDNLDVFALCDISAIAAEVLESEIEEAAADVGISKRDTPPDTSDRKNEKEPGKGTRQATEGNEDKARSFGKELLDSSLIGIVTSAPESTIDQGVQGGITDILKKLGKEAAKKAGKKAAKSLLKAGGRRLIDKITHQDGGDAEAAERERGLALEQTTIVARMAAEEAVRRSLDELEPSSLHGARPRSQDRPSPLSLDGSSNFDNEGREIAPLPDLAMTAEERRDDRNIARIRASLIAAGKTVQQADRLARLKVQMNRDWENELDKTPWPGQAKLTQGMIAKMERLKAAEEAKEKAEAEEKEEAAWAAKVAEARAAKAEEEGVTEQRLSRAERAAEAAIKRAGIVAESVRKNSKVKEEFVEQPTHGGAYWQHEEPPSEPPSEPPNEPPRKPKGKVAFADDLAATEEEPKKPKKQVQFADDTAAEEKETPSKPAKKVQYVDKATQTEPQDEAPPAEPAKKPKKKVQFADAEEKEAPVEPEAEAPHDEPPRKPRKKVQFADAEEQETPVEPPPSDEPARPERKLKFQFVDRVSVAEDEPRRDPIYGDERGEASGQNRDDEPTENEQGAGKKVHWDPKIPNREDSGRRDPYRMKKHEGGGRYRDIPIPTFDNATHMLDDSSSDEDASGDEATRKKHPTYKLPPGLKSVFAYRKKPKKEDAHGDQPPAVVPSPPVPESDQPAASEEKRPEAETPEEDARQDESSIDLSPPVPESDQPAASEEEKPAEDPRQDYSSIDLSPPPRPAPGSSRLRNQILPSEPEYRFPDPEDLQTPDPDIENDADDEDESSEEEWGSDSEIMGHAIPGSGPHLNLTAAEHDPHSSPIEGPVEAPEELNVDDLDLEAEDEPEPAPEPNWDEIARLIRIGREEQRLRREEAEQARAEVERVRAEASASGRRLSSAHDRYLIDTLRRRPIKRPRSRVIGGMLAHCYWADDPNTQWKIVIPLLEDPAVRMEKWKPLRFIQQLKQKTAEEQARPDSSQVPSSGQFPNDRDPVATPVESDGTEVANPLQDACSTESARTVGTAFEQIRQLEDIMFRVNAMSDAMGAQEAVLAEVRAMIDELIEARAAACRESNPRGPPSAPPPAPTKAKRDVEVVASKDAFAESARLFGLSIWGVRVVQSGRACQGPELNPAWRACAVAA